MSSLHTIISDLTPWVMVIILAIQTWMVKQIIDFGRWRAMQDQRNADREPLAGKVDKLDKWSTMAEERCQQHGKRDDSLDQQMPVALKVLQDHGHEMEGIRTTVMQLTQRITDGFNGIDSRLDKLDADNTAILQIIGTKHEDEP